MTRRSLTELLGEPPEPEEAIETDWAKLRAGVTAAWLAGALGRDPKTIKKRLGPCTPKGKRNGAPIYDLEEAMSYCVKPRFDIKDYLKTMNPTELPPMLRKEYWDAELKKMNWQERAGELWRTADVLEVLAEAFKRIKAQMQIWADDVEREANMTPEQYKALTARVDALRRDLNKVLVDMPAQRKHGSVLDEGPMDDEDPS